MGEPFLRLVSKPEPEAALNLAGIDFPPAGSKAIAKTELHALGEPSRGACHDLIGKPEILVCAADSEGFGGGEGDAAREERFALTGGAKGEGKSPITRASSKLSHHADGLSVRKVFPSGPRRPRDCALFPRSVVREHCPPS